jgi:hypothetical protein
MTVTVENTWDVEPTHDREPTAAEIAVAQQVSAADRWHDAAMEAGLVAPETPRTVTFGGAG